MAKLRKIVLRTCLLLIILLPLTLLGAAMMAFSSAPLTTSAFELTPAHIARAKTLLDKNDPRNMPDNRVATVQLTGSDLNLVASYAATRVGGAAEIVLMDRE